MNRFMKSKKPGFLKVFEPTPDEKDDRRLMGDLSSVADGSTGFESIMYEPPKFEDLSFGSTTKGGGGGGTAGNESNGEENDKGIRDDRVELHELEEDDDDSSASASANDATRQKIQEEQQQHYHHQNQQPQNSENNQQDYHRQTKQQPKTGEKNGANKEPLQPPPVAAGESPKKSTKPRIMEQDLAAGNKSPERPGMPSTNPKSPAPRTPRGGMFQRSSSERRFKMMSAGGSHSSDRSLTSSTLDPLQLEELSGAQKLTSAPDTLVRHAVNLKTIPEAAPSPAGKSPRKGGLFGRMNNGRKNLQSNDSEGSNNKPETEAQVAKVSGNDLNMSFAQLTLERVSPDPSKKKIAPPSVVREEKEEDEENAEELPDVALTKEKRGDDQEGAGSPQTSTEVDAQSQRGGESSPVSSGRKARTTGHSRGTHKRATSPHPNKGRNAPVRTRSGEERSGPAGDKPRHVRSSSSGLHKGEDPENTRDKPRSQIVGTPAPSRRRRVSEYQRKSERNLVKKTLDESEYQRKSERHLLKKTHEESQSEKKPADPKGKKPNRRRVSESSRGKYHHAGRQSHEKHLDLRRFERTSKKKERGQDDDSLLGKIVDPEKNIPVQEEVRQLLGLPSKGAKPNDSLVSKATDPKRNTITVQEEVRQLLGLPPKAAKASAGTLSHKQSTKEDHSQGKKEMHPHGQKEDHIEPQSRPQRSRHDVAAQVPVREASITEIPQKLSEQRLDRQKPTTSEAVSENGVREADQGARQKVNNTSLDDHFFLQDYEEHKQATHDLHSSPRSGTRDKGSPASPVKSPRSSRGRVRSAPYSPRSPDKSPTRRRRHSTGRSAVSSNTGTSTIVWRRNISHSDPSARRLTSANAVGRQSSPASIGRRRRGSIPRGQLSPTMDGCQHVSKKLALALSSPPLHVEFDSDRDKIVVGQLSVRDDDAATDGSAHERKGSAANFARVHGDSTHTVESVSLGSIPMAVEKMPFYSISSSFLAAKESLFQPSSDNDPKTPKSVHEVDPLDAVSDAGISNQCYIGIPGHEPLISAKKSTTHDVAIQLDDGGTSSADGPSAGASATATDAEHVSWNESKSNYLGSHSNVRAVIELPKHQLVANAPITSFKPVTTSPAKADVEIMRPATSMNRALPLSVSPQSTAEKDNSSCRGTPGEVSMLSAAVDDNPVGNNRSPPQAAEKEAVGDNVGDDDIDNDEDENNTIILELNELAEGAVADHDLEILRAAKQAAFEEANLLKAQNEAMRLSQELLQSRSRVGKGQAEIDTLELEIVTLKERLMQLEKRRRDLVEGISK